MSGFRRKRQSEKSGFLLFRYKRVHAKHLHATPSQAPAAARAGPSCAVHSHGLFFSFLFFFNLERGGRSPQRHLVPTGDRAEASERKKAKKKKKKIIHIIVFLEPACDIPKMDSASRIYSRSAAPVDHSEITRLVQTEGEPRNLWDKRRLSTNGTV